MSNLFTATITFNNKDWYLSNEGYSGEEYYLPHITQLPSLDLGTIKGGYFGVKLGSVGILNKPQDRFSPFSIYTNGYENLLGCLLYTSPSPRDRQKSRMPSSA